MPDEEHIASNSARKRRLRLAHDAGLSIGRAFPSPHALVRPAEELVRDFLELRRRQEAGRRAVVLVHRLNDLDGDSERGGERLGRLDRLALSARDHMAGTGEPTRRGESTHPLAAGSIEAPLRHGNRRVHLDLRMGQVADDLSHEVSLLCEVDVG